MHDENRRSERQDPSSLPIFRASHYVFQLINVHEDSKKVAINQGEIALTIFMKRSVCYAACDAS